MTQPYGKPFTVRGWGDEVVTTVTVDDERERVEGYTHVVRTEGPVILVPTVALTPVDITPAEPEPGAAYQLGRAAVMRFPDQSGDVRWFWAELTSEGSCRWDWDSWPDLWRRFGGPGVTIRRLIPEPAPVQLPWDPNPLDPEHLNDRPTRTSVRAVGYWVHDENQVGRTSNVVRLTADDAELKAAALLTAARAAREATR
jgi:hypothetical protein